jgi:ligand-binding SRPBCC domain-containing protein
MQRVERKQFLPITIAEAWTFFSDAENLSRITPPEMGFRITSPKHIGPVYPGMIISYSVRPILSIPLPWITEITRVKQPEYFIDDQRVGPYKLWHHQHVFKQVDGGVEMTDIIHYQAPFGFIGRLAESLFINRKVKHIFDYRSRVLMDIFPSDKNYF